MKLKHIIVLCFILALSNLGSAAYAASEPDTAAAYLAERGIIEGDENGDLHLNEGLTRAELAVILTRLDFIETPGGLDEWEFWGMAHFTDPEYRYNPFTDIPDWALPYIEYCYELSLMKGIGGNQFDPQGMVNPKMACTVILRHLGIAETDWNYDSSVTKARSLGIAPDGGTDGDTLFRGAMAVIIKRGMGYANDNAAPGAVPAEISAPSDVPAEISAPAETPRQDDAPAMTIDEMKAEIVRRTNAERTKAGLPEVEVLPALMACAQAKADDIGKNGYRHISPVYGTAKDIIKAAVPEMTSYAENLAPWTKTPEEAFAGWVESPPHYASIINQKYTHIGVGVLKGAGGGYWWVLQLIKL